MWHTVVWIFQELNARVQAHLAQEDSCYRCWFICVFTVILRQFEVYGREQPVSQHTWWTPQRLQVWQRGFRASLQPASPRKAEQLFWGQGAGRANYGQSHFPGDMEALSSLPLARSGGKTRVGKGRAVKYIYYYFYLRCFNYSQITQLLLQLFSNYYFFYLNKIRLSELKDLSMFCEIWILGEKEVHFRTLPDSQSCHNHREINLMSWEILLLLRKQCIAKSTIIN